jgi:hypothetical protein
MGEPIIWLVSDFEEQFRPGEEGGIIDSIGENYFAITSLLNKYGQGTNQPLNFR